MPFIMSPLTSTCVLRFEDLGSEEVERNPFWRLFMIINDSHSAEKPRHLSEAFTFSIIAELVLTKLYSCLDYSISPKDKTLANRAHYELICKGKYRTL